jgi:uncharacterized protein (TIGR03067 family)
MATLSPALFRLILATSLVGGSPDDEDARDASRKDLDRLQGVWTLVSMEREGEVVPADQIGAATATYARDALVLRAGDEIRRRGIVTLDAGRTPKAINTWDRDGSFADETVPGIYELEGDTLKLCFARPRQTRPTEFTTKQGTGVLLAVYKRKKAP